jgi:hypothetical protein
MRRPRPTTWGGAKPKVAETALRCKTLDQSGNSSTCSPTQARSKKHQAVENLAAAFNSGGCTKVSGALKALRAKLGQATLKVDFFEQALVKAGWLSPPCASTVSTGGWIR